jgi:Mn2+/Fe2+ NRAMP family transporter
MSRTIRTERRKRGFFGWIFLILFFGFNAMMLYGTFAGLAGTGQQITAASSDAERTGAAIGTAIGVSMILVVWAAGAVILGLLVLLTPGRKVIVETVESGR